MNTIRSIIEQHIHLDFPNTKGWYPVLCRVCNDHGKKGKRAAFIFTDHGTTYNCFNCGHTAGYEPAFSIAENGEHHISQNMITVFDSFGIPKTEWEILSLEARKSNFSAPNLDFVEMEPKEIPLLPFFYPLTDDKNDEWCQAAIDYLTERGVVWTTQPFYCVKLDKNHPTNKKWYGRIIIPIYKDNKLIFFQGRDLTGLHSKKYININVPRDNVLYGYDQIFLKTTEPLYITEGWFDAHLLKGVAVLGRNMTAQQIKWLNKTARPKIVIPDRTGDGYQLAEQAIQLDWNISTIDHEDTDCKDVNDSMLKHGMFYTLKTIIDNTSTNNITAAVRLNSFCRGDINKWNNQKKKQKNLGK